MYSTLIEPPEVTVSGQCIAVFGGTFDPVHNGHLEILSTLSACGEFDKIIALPCKVPALKKIPNVNEKDRLHMLQLALQNTDIIIDEQELQRGSPSYSIDSINALRREFPDARIYFVVGVDAMLDFMNWHQPAQYHRLCHLLLVKRAGYSMDAAEAICQQATFSQSSLSARSAKPQGSYVVLEQDFMDISSTRLREMLYNGDSCKNYIPSPVLDYINTHRLYTHD